MMEELVAKYKEKSPGSASAMSRSSEIIAGGVSRNFGYHIPYPVVNVRGAGVYLEDIDNNRYIDLAYNGLSLIHGHAPPPIAAEIGEALSQGWAWPGTSLAQIEFGEALARRIPGTDKVRFTNSGTEAMMLAVKIARHLTKRTLLIKANAAYHGSFPDLEAGLHGAGPVPGRTVVCDFGDADAFADTIRANHNELAAVVIEPVLVTGGIVPPPDGFLKTVTRTAREHGVLVVLDDCLMFRLAAAGSSEFFDIEADLVVLGKFIGGGLPMGAVCGSDAVMGVFSDDGNPLYHGGSFNGNVLASRAGLKSLEMLTPESIGKMNDQAATIRDFLEQRSALQTFNPTITAVGSVVGIHFSEEGQPAKDYHTQLNRNLGFHLACLIAGIQLGAGGIFSLVTAFDNPALDELKGRLATAIDLFCEAA
jgi:glutamate-1-semialdehyde 2,1-aminomutase